jgi:O-antigen ligase/Flp pilus assembly protein TadD
VQQRRAPARVRTEQLARWAIWLAVLSSVAFLPGALNRWVLPKDLMLAVACVLGAVVAARIAPASRVPRWLWLLLAAGVAVLLVAAVLSDAPLAQLFGRWPRYEGLVTLPVYVGALWLGATLLGDSADGSRRATLLSAVTAASLALGAISVLEAIGAQLISTDADRPGALLGNATDQGIVAAMFFAVLVMPVIRSWIAPDAAPSPSVSPSARRPARTQQRPAQPAPVVRPWWPLAGTVAAILTVVISASRAAFVAAVVVVVGAVVLELVRRRVRAHNLQAGEVDVAPAASAPSRAPRTPVHSAARRARLLAVAIAVAGAAAILLAFPLMARRILGLTPLASSTIDDRLTIYTSAGELARDNLLLGVGPSGFVGAIPAYFDADWYATVGADTTLDSPHNWVLQALVAGGVPLLLVALAVAGAVAWIGVRRWRSAVASDAIGSDLLASAGLAVAGFGVALLTHFTSPGTTIVAALLLGVLLAVPTPQSAPARTLGPATRNALVRARPVVMGVWALALVLATSAELSLSSGVSQAASGDVAAADSSFSSAFALRPWDADAASIAAESMAHAAEGEVPGAAQLATSYAQRALRGTPDSVLASKALAIGQQYSGELEDARTTLEALRTVVPLDGGVAQRLGGISVLLGDFSVAETQLLEAVTLLPGDPAPWQTLEYLYQQTGDSDAEASAREQIDTLSAAQ